MQEEAAEQANKVEIFRVDAIRCWVLGARMLARQSVRMQMHASVPFGAHHPSGFATVRWKGDLHPPSSHSPHGTLRLHSACRPNRPALVTCPYLHTGWHALRHSAT